MASTGSGGTATILRDEAVGLSHDELRQMFELMLLTRFLDERIWLLNRAGRAPFAISAQGHEGAQAGMAFALDPSKDWLHPYYRDLAMVLHFGLTPRGVLLGVLSKQEDPSGGGRQMPMHYGSRKHRIVTGSSPVGTQIAQAPGIALAARARGEDSVVYTSIGEGGTSEGDFHEGLNWASIYKLPVIFFVQNNEYAISVPLSKQMAVRDVSARAAAYAMPGFSVDGSDAVAVHEVAREAVRRARAGEGPTLIEAKVQRFQPHSSDDDHSTYRSREEIESLRSRDPIIVTRARLQEMGALNEEQEAEMSARVKQQVNEATDYAENAALPDPATLLDHVYAPEGARV